jgi:hypothetical protein
VDVQRIARVTGILWLITFITSIPALSFSTSPFWTIPTTSFHKRQSEGLALGFVTARLVECTFIAVGLLSLLAVVTLRQDVGGTAGADSLVGIGRSLVAIHDWTFLLGPGWVVGVGNGLILGYLMYRSGLVPRGMTMLGLIGGPLIIASGTAVMFDVFEPGSAPQVIATIPEFLLGAESRPLPHHQRIQAVAHHRRRCATAWGEKRPWLPHKGSATP